MVAKQEVLNAIDMFGLTMDYDQWDVEDKGWIRIKTPEWVRVKPEHYKTYGVLIIYKEDTKTLEDALEELRNHMYRIGEYLLKDKLTKLIVL